MPIILWLLLALAVCLIPTQAHAQSALPLPGAAAVQAYSGYMAQRLQCGPGQGVIPRKEWVHRLANEFFEFHAAAIYLMPGAIAELFINRGTGSWTIIRSGPQKQSCFVTSGFYPFGTPEF